MQQTAMEETNEDKPWPADADSDNGIKFKDWGFKVDRLFEVAYRFYKRNESKAFHPSFDERNRMNALILQARFGNYDNDKVPDVGLLDLVGKSRHHQWSLLHGLSKLEAMSKFICTLDEICPLFKAHAEAVKLISEQQNLNKSHENGRDRSNSEKLREVQSETVEELGLIKKSLSRQTYSQFKSYAEKQYPDDSSKQKYLIDSLQEQYYQQYISQMYPDSSSYTNGNSAEGTSQDNLNPQDRLDSDQSATQLTTSDQSISTNETTATNHPADCSPTAQNIPQLSLHPDDHPEQQTEAVAPIVAEQSIELVQDNDSSCSSLSEESSLHRSLSYEALEPATVWTKKGVKDFKDSLIGDQHAGEYLLKQGKLVTIQVPTYPNGKYIYWEFVTEDYDIGFGLDFAYEDHQDSLDLKIFEQTDDEDDDLIEAEEFTGRDATEAQTSHPSAGNLDKPPKVENTIAIIPTYRRNSHEEVFIGRHRYPGHGYYLLRFDNTYSVLRSKSLFFRICYFI